MSAFDRVFVRHPPEPGDLALVFGHHHPPTAIRRAHHAADLFQQRLVPRLLFSGGGPQTDDGATEAGIMLDSAISLGVPREAILIEPFSRTTVENVRCSMEILRTGNLLESLKTILLVSCPWHMGRILRIMKGAVPAHVRLLCCPQMRDCTENNWRECDECSRRVNAEAEFLDLLIRRGALPEYC